MFRVRVCTACVVPCVPECLHALHALFVLHVLSFGVFKVRACTACFMLCGAQDAWLHSIRMPCDDQTAFLLCVGYVVGYSECGLALHVLCCMVFRVSCWIACAMP